MNLKKLVSISKAHNLKNKKVLVRVDFNVTLSDAGVVLDDFRIRQSLETITYLQNKGAKVILMSHLESASFSSLEPVSIHLKKYVDHVFIPTLFSNEMNQILKDQKMGEVILLENVRLDVGEKKNDPVFAKKLTDLADIYVNEAFSASHRNHASTAGVPEYLPSYAGFQLMREVDVLKKAFTPTHPFVFILGGAKFESKIPLLERFLVSADKVLIIGALANDIYKAKGYEVGLSLVGDTPIPEISKNPKILVPETVVVNGPQGTRTVSAQAVNKDEHIYDADPVWIQSQKELFDASFIIWNGPAGMYEAGYQSGTKAVAESLAQSKAMSLVGGGDTVAAIQSLNVSDKLSFISTGGGAMLDFLSSGGEIPGLVALVKHRPSLFQRWF